MKRILVVEDDRSIADALRSTLTAEGFKVEVARDGEVALTLFHQTKPDLVVLDRMLPKVDGIEVLRAMRQTDTTPVLILTAKDEVSDKVTGLRMGADDYMTKPFSVHEFVARIHALLRRTKSDDTPSQIQVGSLLVDLTRRTVTVDGRAIEMTRTEFDLLVLFVRNPEIVLTREKLLEDVWGYRFEGYSRTVDTHVTRLRKKIEIDPHNPQMIQTVWGMGYRFSPSTEGR